MRRATKSDHRERTLAHAYKVTDMGGSREDDEPDVREEGHRVNTDDGWKYVIFDPKNPLAWVLSDWFGLPPDRREGDEAGEEEEPSE